MNSTHSFESENVQGKLTQALSEFTLRMQPYVVPLQDLSLDNIFTTKRLFVTGNKKAQKRQIFMSVSTGPL